MFPLNSQPVSRITTTPEHIEVVSLDKTLQGEGPDSGVAATFVRLYGCIFQCPMCDTDYSSTSFRWKVWDLVKEVTGYGNELVVVTGGEPLRQDLSVFTRLLQGFKHRVQIETTGSVWNDLPYGVELVVSPKQPAVNAGIAQRAIAYKYVIDSGCVIAGDGLPEHQLGCSGVLPVARPPREFFDRDMVFVQPADEGDEAKNKGNLDRCVQLAMMHKGVRASVQLHKVLGLP